MKAIAIDDYDATPALVDLPVPEPGDGEILVRNRWSSVNGFDLGVVGGFMKDWMAYNFPVILGKDFAGTVAAVGNGVDRFQVGDTVFGTMIKPALGDGAFAEYLTVDQGYAASVPDGLDLATAGVLGLAGSAALDSLDALDLEPGETVLIAGATGGVGTLAVQLAAARGVRVIGTARTDDGTRLIAELGCADIVDYNDDLAESTRALSPDGVDAAVHLAGDGVRLADVLAPGGRIASPLMLTQDALTGRDVRCSPIITEPVTATLERLADAVVAGDLSVPVQRTYQLEEAPQALIDFTSGTRGKLAIEID